MRDNIVNIIHLEHSKTVTAGYKIIMPRTVLCTNE